jgi:hypothetical protein
VCGARHWLGRPITEDVDDRRFQIDAAGTLISGVVIVASTIDGVPHDPRDYW